MVYRPSETLKNTWKKKGTQAAKIVEEWKDVAEYNRNTKSCAAPDHRGINIMV